MKIKRVLTKAKKVKSKSEDKKIQENDIELTEKEVEGFISKLGFKKLGKDYQTIADKDVNKYIGDGIDEGEEQTFNKDESIKNKSDKKTESKKNLINNNNSKPKDEDYNNKKQKNKFKINEKPKSKEITIIPFSNKNLQPSNIKETAFSINKWKDGNSGGRLLMQTGLWTQNEFKDDPTTFEVVSKEKESELMALAKELMKIEIENYGKKSENKKDKSGAMKGWLKVMQSKGTSGDKMAAWVLMVQESNVHNLHHVDQMVSLVLKHRSKSFEALESVKDLFLQVLLPVRKLRSFNQNPLSQLEVLSSGNKDFKAKRLIIWLFENSLKQKYADFLNALEVLMRDNVEAVRRKATAIVLELLCENAEGEKVLLAMLVNKLGDPSTKVSSNVIHFLNKLLVRHGAMKKVVAFEVERLLYRPNVSPKAQFYAICFLGSLKLNETDTDLACKLLDVYFTFFKMYIKKGDLESKMLAALLTGINKTYTYAKVNKEEIEGHAASLYKLTHMARFNTALLALMLLYQIMDVNEKTADRFYVALYNQLMDAQLPTSNKLPLFLNLLCKAMKKDTIERRVQAFVKRLLQVCQSFTPGMVCSALYLLSDVASERPDILKLQQEAENEDEDDDEEYFVDHDDDEKMDEGEDEVKKVKDDSDGEVEGDDEFNDDDDEKEEDDKKKVVPSWIHRNTQQFKCKEYDPRHRNPLYCRADLDCISELSLLLHHYHPSVVVFAQNLFDGDAIKYSGDPLTDFTFKRFLSRFITKNPKKEGVDDIKDKKSEKKKHEDDEVDDDEEVEEVNDNEDVYFGDDLKDAFKHFDDDINDNLMQDDDDDEEEENEVIGDGQFIELDEDELDNEGDDEDDEDEDKEDDDDDMEDLFGYSDKDLKQMKWEDSNEKRLGPSGTSVKGRGMKRKGPVGRSFQKKNIKKFKRK